MGHQGGPDCRREATVGSRVVRHGRRVVARVTREQQPAVLYAEARLLEEKDVDARFAERTAQFVHL